MKKLLFYMAALFTLTFCFGFNSKADTLYSSADLQKLKSEFYSKYNVNISDNYATQVLSYWASNSSIYPYMFVSKFTNVTPNVYNFNYATRIINQNSSTITINGIYTTRYVPDYSGTVVVNPNNLPAGSLDLNANNTYNFGTWSSFHIPDIDWDTVYYSANILPPDLDITYRELSSVPIVDVPLNVDLVAEPQNVYVEIGAVFECPDEIDAYSENGVYTYHALDTLGFAMTIIDKEDLFLASNASSSYIHLALNEAWQDVYDQIPISDITWYTDQNYSTALVNNMKSRFENLRKVSCFYGNELKLFVRYFVINNDTQFVVGPWRIWNSKTPNSFTDQTPTWYQPYIPASGTTGTSTNTGSNTQQDPDVITIPPGSGEPTGIYYNPTTNITVGSNVPNYPDYPTIRSYNADNFLVQTMNYLDYLNNDESEKTLFGEFGKFLATVFVFIPGEIWTIIAVGFSLVIVVMFLKIL